MSNSIFFERPFTGLPRLRCIVLATMLAFGCFCVNSFAYQPPAAISVTPEPQPGGFTRYRYTITDQQRGQSFSGTSDVALNSGAVWADGVAAWITALTDAFGVVVGHRINYVVWDPAAGTFRTGSSSTSFGYHYAGGLMTSKGIVFWTWSNATTPVQQHTTTYNIACFDPVPGLVGWKLSSTVMSDFIDGIGSRVPGAAYIGGGVAAWPYNEGDGFNGFGSKSLYTFAFDAAAGGWVQGLTSSFENGQNSYSINPITPITNGTVNYRIGATSLTRGYSRPSWHLGSTTPLAGIVASQTSGPAPLSVQFWDVSLGGSGWIWNFGDNTANSSEQSPFHIYGSLSGSPFTTTQTVSGPGGPNSSAPITIVITTVNSVSGHVANRSGFVIPGATITLTGPSPRSTPTDGNGNYSFINLAGGAYSVAATKPAYSFTPSPQQIPNLNGPQTINFTGILNNKPGDLDGGDNKTDFAIVRPLSGGMQWWILNSSNGSSRVETFGLVGDMITPGDFDGDGKTDIAVWRSSDGNFYYMRSSNGTFAAFHYGVSSDIPVARDFDGDDKTDFAVFRPSEGNWYINKSSNGQNSVLNYGLSVDKVVPGDYDGDGKADMAVWRPGNSTFYVLKSSNGAEIQQVLGLATDQPSVGDYDGDGKMDFAVFRETDGVWTVKRSVDSIVYSVQWGQLGDLAAPGDYDGDGKYDIAIFRPSNGTWWVLKSSDQGTIVVTWGQSGDLPVPGGYLPH